MRSPAPASAAAPEPIRRARPAAARSDARDFAARSLPPLCRYRHGRGCGAARGAAVSAPASTGLCARRARRGGSILPSAAYALRPRLAGRVAGAPRAWPGSWDRLGRREGSAARCRGRRALLSRVAVPWPSAAVPRRIPGSSVAGYRAAASRSARPARRRGGRLSGCIVELALGHLGSGRGPCRCDPSPPGRARPGTRPGAPQPRRRRREPSCRRVRAAPAAGWAAPAAPRCRSPRCRAVPGVRRLLGPGSVQALAWQAEGARRGGDSALAIAKGDLSVGKRKPPQKRCRICCKTSVFFFSLRYKPTAHMK